MQFSGEQRSTARGTQAGSDRLRGSCCTVIPPDCRVGMHGLTRPSPFVPVRAPSQTIGDAYMLVGNVTAPCPRHADLVLEFGILMHQRAAGLRVPASAGPEGGGGQPLRIRVGVHSGSVVSGWGAQGVQGVGQGRQGAVRPAAPWASLRVPFGHEACHRTRSARDAASKIWAARLADATSPLAAVLNVTPTPFPAGWWASACPASACLATPSTRRCWGRGTGSGLEPGTRGVWTMFAVPERNHAWAPGNVVAFRPSHLRCARATCRFRASNLLVPF